jgi:hypothetical protein
VTRPGGEGAGHPIGAVDRTSSFADVADAFARHGAKLLAEPASGSSWVATVTVGRGPSLRAHGASRDEAARAAWVEYVERNGGTGVS